jgi:hypothetical protein
LEFKDRRSNRRGLADQVRTLIRRAHELVDSVDPATMNRVPPGGGWSAAQCIEHLNETARVYLPVLAEAIEQGRTGDPSGVGEGRTLLGRVVVWAQEPPVRFRFRTFDSIRPPNGDLDPAQIVADFETLHEELIVRINESGSTDRKRIRIRSVLDPRLKLSLGDWFAFLAAHGRRHLWQAERALEAAPESGAG